MDARMIKEKVKRIKMAEITFTGEEEENGSSICIMDVRNSICSMGM